jgi:hypothetical protein
MEQETSYDTERRGFTLLLVGGLLTLVSPLASLLFVLIGNVAGPEATLRALSLACAATFVTGLVITAAGFGRRATQRLEYISTQPA